MGRAVLYGHPRSPTEEAGPLKGSPVSVRLRPGARKRYIGQLANSGSRKWCTECAMANAMLHVMPHSPFCAPECVGIRDACCAWGKVIGVDVPLAPQDGAD